MGDGINFRLERLKTLVKTKFRLEGSYKGIPNRTSMAPSGYYLPSVYFNILEDYVASGHKLNVKAECEKPTNRGSEDEVVARIKIHAKMSASNWFGKISNSVAFVADGADGMMYAG